MAFAKITLPSPDVQTTLTLAERLARQTRSGDCILLRGDLGAGKTTFARGFIQELRPKEKNILSPTFSLVQSYTAAASPTIWHYDLYRLTHEEEVAELGLEEALRLGITLIEWPDLAESYLSGAVLDVTVAISDEKGRRDITFAGPSAWQARLDALKDPPDEQ